MSQPLKMERSTIDELDELQTVTLTRLANIAAKKSVVTRTFETAAVVKELFELLESERQETRRYQAYNRVLNNKLDEIRKISR